MPSTEPSTQTTDNESPTKPRILIADDDHNSASFLVWAVRHLGYVAEWVTDGQVAYQRAKESKPLAILLDIMMPGFDGVVSLRLLQMNEITRNIPIIVISGASGLRDAEKVVEEGAKTFIQKPLTIDILKRALDEFAPLPS